MHALPLINADASVIAVTGTATLFTALVDTAAGADQQFPIGVDTVILNPENGDIRALWDGNAPTASKGLLVKRGTTIRIPKIQLDLLKLIRTGSTDVNVGIVVGTAEPNDNEITGVAGEVGINTATSGINGAGAEESSVLALGGRRSDAFHANYNGASNTNVQAVKAAVADKKHYIETLIISTDTAQWVSIVDGASTVLFGPYYMPANSVLPVPIKEPVPGSINTALNVDCGGSLGNVTVTIDGYTI